MERFFAAKALLGLPSDMADGAEQQTLDQQLAAAQQQADEKAARAATREKEARLQALLVFNAQQSPVGKGAPPAEPPLWFHLCLE